MRSVFCGKIDAVHKSYKNVEKCNGTDTDCGRCLGNSIMALGSNPKTAWMFEDQSVVFKDGTCSRFAQIVTALK